MSGYRDLNPFENGQKDSIILYPSDPVILERFLLRWLTGEKELKFSGYYLMKLEALYAEKNNDYKYSLERVNFLKMLLDRKDLNNEDKRYVRGRLYSLVDECEFEINVLEKKLSN